MKRNDLIRLFSGVGLAVLLAVNAGPILLVIRQAFSPESESVAWPLAFLPGHLTLENLATLWRAQALLGHLGLSLFVAGMTTLLAVALGYPAGWAAARLPGLGGGVTRLSLVSRILPPIAIAIPLASILIGFRLYNHPLGWGLIVAHLTIALPFAVLMAFAAFRDLPPELEEAAAVDGCSPAGGFVRVALPAVRGSIAGAAILSFLLSWDEFAYAIIIQVTHRTMPPLIYYYTNFGQLGAASALATLMLVPALAVIVTLQRLLAGSVSAGDINR